MIRLSARLQLVFDNLIAGEDVWDFCCDHGYLGGAAYKSELFKNVYFIDPVESIMEKLKTHFYKFVFNEKNNSLPHFKPQLGQTIDESVKGTVSIVGVGGFLIYEILSGLADKKLLVAQRLILGPHRDGEKLLAMLTNNSRFNNYGLSSQKEVVENNRTRIFYIFDLKKSD